MSLSGTRSLACTVYRSRKFQFASLRLLVEFGQDCDLDGTGLGKHFIAMQEKFLAAAEIENSNSKHAIKIVVHFTNRGFELLPQDVLFGGNLRRDHGGAKNKKDDVFQRGRSSGEHYSHFKPLSC